MEQRDLGTSGGRVSRIGLGCNSFGSRVDLEGARRVVHTALDCGITLLDTADVYGLRFGNASASERFLGEILGSRRREVFLATKFGNPRMPYGKGIRPGSGEAIRRAVEGSLTRLNTDWIDLYQMHMPDPVTPIEETLRALDDLVRQGKVRSIGCSNFRAWQVVEAQWTARHLKLAGFVSCQDEYSLLARDAEQDLVPVMERYGLGLLPYFPLAGGLLTGKYRRNAAPPDGTRFAVSRRISDYYLTEQNWNIVEQLESFCAARGRTLLELAFAWLLSRSVVAGVIAGATSPEQVRANVGAASWQLTGEEAAAVDALCVRPRERVELA